MSFQANFFLPSHSLEYEKFFFSHVDSYHPDVSVADFSKPLVKRKDLPNLLNHGANFTDCPCLDDNSKKYLQDFYDQCTLYILINQDSRGCIHCVFIFWPEIVNNSNLTVPDRQREGRKEGRAEGRISSIFFTKRYVMVNIYLYSFQKQTELLSNG